MSNNTRERVLKTLLMNQQNTVNELAEAVDINPISVRHHVNKLEAEGLIQSEEERHGVGRPRLVYSLTNKGREQFPKRYLDLTLRILAQLKESLSPQMVGELFQEIARDMAEEITADFELEDLSLAERLKLLQSVLNQEGFTVNVVKEDGEYYLVEASCPYHHVGEDHPEICVVDQELISRFVTVPPKRIECMLDGGKRCVYKIPELSN
ncbi:MAG: ArsR family transcriptional regulator [Anaerolineales bacterium]|nr:ArsR family transcriptional regulator [Anaerolineales bacterium]